VFLAQVIGTVIAARKYEGLEGVKLLVVRAIDKQGRMNGAPQIACDHDIRAGRGDRVYVVTAREASHAMPDRFVPVDLAVVAVVDEVYRP
jgi:ethanolamine utilization protein EutN